MTPVTLPDWIAAGSLPDWLAATGTIAVCFVAVWRRPLPSRTNARPVPGGVVALGGNAGLGARPEGAGIVRLVGGAWRGPRPARRRGAIR
jgi:hypothetical protein